MNIRELIDELQKHDPEMRVVTAGYEGGYCDLSGFEEIKINLDVNNEWYYGKHDNAYGEKFDEIALYI
jgi:hypothetical protein